MLISARKMTQANHWFIFIHTHWFMFISPHPTFTHLTIFQWLLCFNIKIRRQFVLLLYISALPVSLFKFKGFQQSRLGGQSGKGSGNKMTDWILKAILVNQSLFSKNWMMRRRGTVRLYSPRFAASEQMESSLGKLNISWWRRLGTENKELRVLRTFTLVLRNRYSGISLRWRATAETC